MSHDYILMDHMNIHTLFNNVMNSGLFLENTPYISKETEVCRGATHETT